MMGKQRSEVRGQRSEIRGQRSEIRDQRSEVRSQKSEDKSLLFRHSGESRNPEEKQRSEIRGQRSEDKSLLFRHSGESRNPGGRRPYFADECKWSRLVGILRSWMGTPYRHLTMVKGRGADCSLFIAAVLLAAGVLREVHYDYYPRDWHLHTHEELVMTGFIEHLKNNLNDGISGRVWTGDMQPEALMRGDILGFATTRMGMTNHAGIYMGDGTMFHSISVRGVCRAPYGRWWRNRMTATMRLLKDSY